jgi:glycine cleavage system H protein
MNSDPYTEGWFIRIKPSDLSEVDDLMDAGTYDEFEKSQG